MNSSARPNDSIVVTISDVVYGGLGLARVDRYVIFVPAVLPEEKVEVHVLKRHRRFARAIPRQLLAVSPYRISPVCPLFRRPTNEAPDLLQSCPGCTYQHADYAEELHLKQRQMETMLRHAIGKASWRALPPVPSPRIFGYRNKIVLHAGPLPDRRLGYLGEDNRTVIDVPHCPLAVEPIHPLLAKVRANRDVLFLLNDGAAVTFRYTPTDGALQWTGCPPPDSPDLTETTALGPLHVPRSCFFQVNADVADLLLRAVDEQLTDAPLEVVLDLYCGVGVFGLAAARRGFRVIGVDSDRRAIEAAVRNAQALGFPDTHWIAAPVHRVLEKQLGACAAAHTLVIADPPRTGLDPPVRDILARKGPRRLWYVSCAVDTLARDLAVLTRAGYQLAQARLFDMFPRTPYFETLARLER